MTPGLTNSMECTMSKAGSDDITGPDAPGERHDSERLRIRVRAATTPRRRSRFALYRGRPARRVRCEGRPGDFDLAAFVPPRLGRVRFQAPPVNDADADDAGLRGWFAALSALQAGRRTPPGSGGAGAPPGLPN